MRRAFRWLIVGFSLAGLLLLGLSMDFFGLRRGAGQAYTPDHQRLLEVLGPARPIEARLSGGGPYRPYNGTVAGPLVMAARRPSDSARGGAAPFLEAPSGQVPRELVKAISAAGDRTPESQAAVASLFLVQGSPDQAVPKLRHALARKPDEPRFLNDLAAALLTTSEVTGDPWTALEAVDLAQRSLEIEPSLPALFNLALALERLDLRARATTAWERYLEEDSRSEWAQEAAKHLDPLQREVENRAAFRFPADLAGRSAPSENPWAARLFGEQVLLTRWAEQSLAGQTSGAEAALSEAEDLAAALSGGGGRLLAESIAAIREAEQTGDRERLDRLARGHQAFGRAVVHGREEQYEAARTLLESAIRDLRDGGSPFELRARVLRAWVVTEPDWAELRDLVAAREKGFPSIAAEAQRITAFRISLEGRLEPAVGVYEDARRLYDELGEREGAAVIAVMLAELHSALGRDRETATEMAAAVAAGPWAADPYNRYTLYVVAGRAALGRFARAAVELRLEAADACRALPERPLCAVDSWLGLAALTEDPAVAETALQRAGELLPETPDSERKARTEIDLAAARARWMEREDGSPDDWLEAAKMYGEAAESYGARGLTVPAVRVRASRARLLERLGRVEEALAEYRASLGIFRRWDRNERFRPESTETRSPRELRAVYERLLALELDRAGNQPSPAAFLLSEEMRDRLAPRRTAELWLPDEADIARFVREVPPGTAWIEYVVLNDRIVVWTLAGGRLDQVILNRPEKLGRRILSLAAETDLADWKQSSAALFHDFLEPALKRLPPGTQRLILVPDSELYGVPFRALWDPASGRYLDERFTIVLTPSVRLGLIPREKASAPGGGLPVLSLGFTDFPGLGLDELPRAAPEASAIRQIYGGASSGGCPGTDWASFRTCAPQAGVLHLATHAAASLGSSWLAFESETITLERLWRELPGLPRRPLVVLSACESVAGAGGEGLGGLARPFLANGAQAVVGTLWEIDDEEAAEVFVAFHQAYHRSGDAAEALRKARESLKDWKDRPWLWGGVEVVGAGL